MERTIDGELLKAWTDKIGGTSVASRLIMDALKCSPSKAEKLAQGRYPQPPKPFDQIELAKLIKVNRDTLFPLVRAS